MLTQPGVAIASIVATATICLCLYWFVQNASGIRQSYYRRYPGEKGLIRHAAFVKLSGLFLLGLLPLGILLKILPVVQWSSIGLGFKPGNLVLSLQYMWALGALAILLSWIWGGTRKSFGGYPGIQVSEWDIYLLLRHALGWLCYLTGFEILFRGILLFPLASSVGIWPAIAINTLIYALYNVNKGPAETVGAVLLGPVLCWVTLKTGMIWAAITVHFIIAFTRNMAAIWYNPELKFVKRRMPDVHSACCFGCECGAAGLTE